MTHTRTPFAAFLTALFTLFAFPAHAGDCLRLCDPGFMQTATAQDIRAEIDKGADIKARTTDSLSPLHFAALLNNAEAVTAIVNAGADVEARTKNESTPLHLAAIRGSAATITALLKAGANEKARGPDGDTPYDLARMTGKLTGTEALQRLEDAAQ